MGQLLLSLSVIFISALVHAYPNQAKLSRCQRHVQKLFADEDFSQGFNPYRIKTSRNHGNVARLFIYQDSESLEYDPMEHAYIDAGECAFRAYQRGYSCFLIGGPIRIRSGISEPNGPAVCYGAVRMY